MEFEAGEINILCSDIEKSLSFYKDVLGFEIIEHEDGAVRLKCIDKIFLLLPFAKKYERKAKYGSIPEISFDLYVNDISLTVDYLKSHKIKILKPLTQKENWIVISDPDGLAIEVIQK